MKKLCWAVLILLTANACKKSTTASSSALLPSSALEQVFTDNTYQLTGVAISQDGRLFTNYPLWSSTYKNAVVEIQSGNQVVPYPNTTMNSWTSGDDGSNKWVCAQAVYVDANNNLWVVDPASPLQQGVYQNSQKLVEIDLSTNSVVRTYSLEGVTDNTSYINDVRVDVNAQVAYLTNSSEGGIIVVDLNMGYARQVLQGNFSVIADQTYILKIDGQQINKNGAPYYGNSDGLALNPDNSYLYYKPLSDQKLYRIPTASLLDKTLSPSVLAATVEDLGYYTTSDGMIFDKQGNLYLGDIEHHRIVRLDANLKTQILVEDDARLLWPDSYSISQDGYLYISCSQIDKGPDFNNGTSKRTTPYAIYRVKLP